jgi:preprotein translocase subunit SecA
MLNFPVAFPEDYFDQDLLEVDEIAKMASDKLIQTFTENMEKEDAKVIPLMQSGFRLPTHPTWEALRHLMIRKLDHFWQEHLLAMDHLRVDVNLRSVGNRDPLTEFKHEAFALFDRFGDTIREDIAKSLFKFQLTLPDPQEIQRILSQMHMERNRSLVEELEAQPEPVTQEQPPQEEKPTPFISNPKTGRNDDCSCGSGKKSKKCCGALAEELN